MSTRRTFIPIGFAALLAAGALGAIVAAQPPQSVAGWEIDVDGSGGYLVMTRQVGPNRIEYWMMGGSHAAPSTQHFRVELITDRGSCTNEEAVSAVASPPAEQAGRIRAQIEAKLASMDSICVLRPAQNAALVSGFDAAYVVLAARFARVQAAFDENPDGQIDQLARMDASRDVDTNMATDTNMTMDISMDTNMSMDANMDTTMNALETRRPRASRTGARPRR